MRLVSPKDSGPERQGAGETAQAGWSTVLSAGCSAPTPGGVQTPRELESDVLSPSPKAL